MSVVGMAKRAANPASDTGIKRSLPMCCWIICTAPPQASAQAGLITGLKAINAGIPLTGIGGCAPKEKQEDSVFNLAVRTAEKLGCPGVVQRADVVAGSSYVGAGYGVPRADTLEAIAMFAQLEGLLLDPVYSGKGAAGLTDYCRKGKFKRGERVVFLHTGGSAALFGYDAVFAEDHKALVV